jgi:hypothetical protein
VTLDEQIENIWGLIDINNNAKTLSIYLGMLRSKVKKKKANAGTLAIQGN